MAKRKRRSRRFRTIVGGIVVLVLLGAAGAVLAVDLHQAHSNKKQNQIQAAKNRAAAGVELQGVVTKVDGNTVTVRAGGKLRRLTMTRNTVVENTATGSDTDLTTSVRGVLRMKRGTKGVAQEVLVLPRTARLGRPIGKVGFGYLWLRTKTGKLGPKTGVTDAVVERATSGSSNDLKVGAKVLVHAQPTVVKPIRLFAQEIVVLPSSTTFVG